MKPSNLKIKRKEEKKTVQDLQNSFKRFRIYVNMKVPEKEKIKKCLRKKKKTTK